MSLVNLITVDLSANTCTLNCTASATLVDNLSYTQSSNTVTFGITPGISLTGQDFVTFVEQMKIFQTAILTNFQPPQFLTQPFTEVKIDEHYISFINSWSMVINIGGASAFVSDICDHATGHVALNARAAPQILNFSEWVMVLAEFSHYEVSIRNFLGI